MSTKPITESSSALLRGSEPAIRRAAQRARERARTTHTRLVVRRNGKLVYLDPSELAPASRCADGPENISGEHNRPS